MLNREPPKWKPIYSTDLSKPLPELIEDLRNQLVKTRGSISDIQTHIGFQDMLETPRQMITGVILYLSYVNDQVSKALVDLDEAKQK